MTKSISLLFIQILLNVVLFQANAQSAKLAIEITADEEWWCGIISRGVNMPLHQKSDFYFDMKLNDCSQVQPLLLSNKGNVIWNDEPFIIQVKEGKMVLTGTGKFLSFNAGNTLQAAQIFARNKFFPASGKLPDTLLISKPQYNTWIELNYNQNQADILKYAHSIIENKMPVGVLMIDDSWQQNFGIWDFRKDRFPDPKAMIKELHDMGFKVMLWTAPFVSTDCLPFLALMNDEKIIIMDSANPQHPYFIKWWEGYSAGIDFTNPKGRNWFLKQLDYLQKEYGIDGFKFDAGDFDRFPASGLTYQKMSGNEHSSIYSSLGLQFPFNEYRATWKMGGQALAQRLCDKEHTWEHLRKLIPEILIMGLSGYTFSCPDMIGGGEIGSYLNKADIDQDLVVRSAQCQALMPMMQFSAAPWRILDSLHMNAIMDALALREKFSHVLVNLAQQSATTGEAIIKPIEFVFPNQGYSKLVNQFMLGDSTMVVPLLEKGTNQRTVYFPKLKKGRWLGDDGKIYKSGTTTLIDVPLNRLPYFTIK